MILYIIIYCIDQRSDTFVVKIKHESVIFLEEEKINWEFGLTQNIWCNAKGNNARTVSFSHWPKYYLLYVVAVENYSNV